MADCYLTLISNSQLDRFPENKPWKFTTRYDNPVTVYPDAVVSLAEISYCKSYELENADHEDGNIKVFDFLYTNNEKTKNKKWGIWKTQHLSKKCFFSPKQIVMCLNEAIWKSIPRLRDKKIEIFSWDSTQRRIWVQFKEDFWITVLIEGSYLYRLGIELQSKPNDLVVLGRDKSKDSYTYEGEKRTFNTDCREKYTSICKKMNYFRFMPHIIDVPEFVIYCDCVTPSYVGGRQINILRFVTPEDNGIISRTVHSYAGDRQYIEMSKFFINTLDIEIRDITGNFVPFDKAVRLVIHIKRAND